MFLTEGILDFYLHHAINQEKSQYTEKTKHFHHVLGSKRDNSLRMIYEQPSEYRWE